MAKKKSQSKSKAQENGQQENTQERVQSAQETVELESRDQEKLDRLMEQRIALDSRLGQIVDQRQRTKDHLDTIEEQERNVSQERAEKIQEINALGQEIQQYYGISFEEYDYDKANGTLVKKEG